MPRQGTHVSRPSPHARGGSSSDGLRASAEGRPAGLAPDVTVLARDDIDLAAAVARGDLDAGRDFFERHADALYRFVHHRAGADRSLTEDVVQETFLRAIARIHTYDGRGGLYPWLCGIAKNRLREVRRHRRPMSLSDALVNADPELDAVLARIATDDLPDAALLAAETAALVDATLASLPVEYARLLVRKYVEGCSTADLAREAGRSDKATESMLARARRGFAEVFELVAKRRGGIG